MRLALTIAVGCGPEPERAPPSPATEPQGAPVVDAVPEPPPACAREPDFDAWAGGRRMRLVTPDLLPGAPATVAVTGATPGDRVVLHLGDVCALDCPPERDGACFQPVGSAPIAEGVADAAGEVQLPIVPEPGWAGRWLALQATAPDAADPYLSQVVVDHVLGEAVGPLLEGRDLRWIAPATVRHQVGWNDVYTLDVAAGRRVRAELRLREPIPPQIESSAWSTAEGVAVEVPLAWHEADAVLALDAWQAGPSNLAIVAAFDYGNGDYDLEVDLVPLDEPVDWYADLDGDGWGDPAGAPIASATPVPGASPEPRDCDDGAGDRHPSAPEACGDGIDQDCDGLDRPCAVDAAALPLAGTLLGGEPGAALGAWLVIGDLTGDGRAELVAGGEPGAVLALEQRDVRRAGGLWFPADGGAVGDVTGDGLADLVLVASRWAPVAVWAGPIDLPLDPSASVRVPVPVAGDPALALGDATGDGVAELLLGSTGGLDLYEGPIGSGAPARTGIPLRQPGLANAAGRIADADGDGLGDVWTSEACLFLSPVPPAGALPDGCAEGVLAGALEVADADGDGRPDLALGLDREARILAAPLAGTMPLDALTTATVAAADFVGAVAIVPDDGGARLALATPSAAWLAPTTAGVHDAEALQRIWSGDRWGGGVHPLWAGDLDGDGRGEVVLGMPEAQQGADWQAGAVYVGWGD